MDLAQPVDQRRHQALDLLGSHAVAPQPALERVALYQRHDHVGRAVGFQEIDDANDGRRVFELGQDPRLVEEALASPDEVLAEIGRSRQDAQPVVAQRQGGRQVFLDGDVAMQLGVVGLIGDAEAAMAEDGDHLEALQHRARRQNAKMLQGLALFLSGRELRHYAQPLDASLRQRL